MSEMLCPFCKSKDLKFVEKKSNPIFIDVKAFVFALSTIFQRKKLILKCMDCGWEKINTKRDLII